MPLNLHNFEPAPILKTADTKKVYFENLDALRFLCFLLVFFFHSFHTDYAGIQALPAYKFIKHGVFGNGNLGVNFFFVLSGFLITFLLIEEKKLNGQIDLRRFWLRRILRIWPLFYACVLFGFYVFPALKYLFGQEPAETASLPHYLTFTNNFDFINNGLPDASVLGVLWSVAIEEQFYLLWPILLLLLDVKRYWIAFSLVILSSLAFRGMYDSNLLHEYHTLSCIGDMAIGAFGAWLVNESSPFRASLYRLSRVKIACVYAAFILIFFFRDELFYSFYLGRMFERSIIAVVMLLIILEQNYAHNSFFKLSRFEWMSKLGRITYGLYCLQFIGILVATHITKFLDFNTELWQVLIVDTTIALGVTISVATLSYRYFEKPFLRMKERFAYITR